MGPRGRHRGYGGNDASGFLALIILAVVAMPIVGLYLTFFSKDTTKRGIGIVILIVWGIGFLAYKI